MIIIDLSYVKLEIKDVEIFDKGFSPLSRM